MKSLMIGLFSRTTFVGLCEHRIQQLRAQPMCMGVAKGLPLMSNKIMM